MTRRQSLKTTRAATNKPASPAATNHSRSAIVQRFRGFRPPLSRLKNLPRPEWGPRCLEGPRPSGRRRDRARRGRASHLRHPEPAQDRLLRSPNVRFPPPRPQGQTSTARPKCSNPTAVHAREMAAPEACWPRCVMPSASLCRLEGREAAAVRSRRERCLRRATHANAHHGKRGSLRLHTVTRANPFRSSWSAGMALTVLTASSKTRRSLI